VHSRLWMPLTHPQFGRDLFLKPPSALFVCQYRWLEDGFMAVFVGSTCTITTNDLYVSRIFVQFQSSRNYELIIFVLKRIRLHMIEWLITIPLFCVVNHSETILTIFRVNNYYGLLKEARYNQSINQSINKYTIEQMTMSSAQFYLS